MLKPFTLIVVTLAVVGSIANYDPANAFESPKQGIHSKVETGRKTLASKSSRSRNVVTIRITLGSPTNNRLFAKYYIFHKYHWKGSQYKCLAKLWQRESGWSHKSKNSSGAYGIPQSLPANKMASTGKDWKTNPATQIKWGSKYIKHRYETPCGALRHSYKYGWY